MTTRTSNIVLIAGALSAFVVLGVVTLKLSERPRPTSRAASRKMSPATAPKLEYVPTPVGAPLEEFGRPQVTSVRVVDLDGDGLPDIIYCESLKNTVRWIRQSPRGVFTEQIIGEDIPGPGHVEPADVNHTGRLDVLVAGMGQIMPCNDKIGAVVVLENVDNQHFRKHVLVDHIARVADVRGGNLVGHEDGRLDLAVGQFGYNQGETRWMENKGNWRFESHIVNTQSGPIHTPIADFDGDGRLDFMDLISQEWEEIHFFRNLGDGQFRDSIIWGSTNEDYGSSGLEVCDVNRDGRPDLVYTNGDGFDYPVQGARPWHGIQWLENRGNGNFAFHRVGDMLGAYGPSAGDLNGDGFIDLVAASCFADWGDPNAISLMAWINDGRQNFTPVVIAHQPTQLLTTSLGDLDGDGVLEIVTGGFYGLPPFVHMSNITVWHRK
jgi:hypothetical protein